MTLNTIIKDKHFHTSPYTPSYKIPTNPESKYNSSDSLFYASPVFNYDLLLPKYFFKYLFKIELIAFSPKIPLPKNN